MKMLLRILVIVLSVTVPFATIIFLIIRQQTRTLHDDTSAEDSSEEGGGDGTS